MSISWKKIPKGLSPYVHWFQQQDAPMLDGAYELLSLRNPPSSAAFQIASTLYAGGTSVPLFEGSGNEAFNWESPLPPDDVLTELASKLEPDSVLTGVIDTGIAIANARFRSDDGAPRVLASWQQTARYQTSSGTILPFGNIAYSNDIKKAMARHSFGDWLDEDALYRELEVSQMGRIFGQRDTELRAAHGTHVADLAAGFDPGAAPADRPMLCVNLPDRVGHGSAGNFLEYYAVFGIDWMIALADALWDEASKKKNWPKKHKACGVPGFPLVINLSYGKQAGSKDGTMPFVKALNATLKAREDDVQSPVYLVLPAGNDNLERAHAHVIMGPRSKKTIATPEKSFDWRVLPSDKTSNFLEIWTAPMKGTTGTGPDVHPIIQLTDPLGKTVEIRSSQANHYADLTGTAWLYTQWYKHDTKSIKLRFILCCRPSLGYDDMPLDNAGLWKITILYEGEPCEFSLNVQSDQALREDSRTGLRAYFDDADYHTHTDEDDTERPGKPVEPTFIPLGKIADSYHYPDGVHLENWNYRGPVQRKGTLNALASTTRFLAIGGYRRSDGAPAPYSSTTFEPLDPKRTKKREILHQPATPRYFLTSLFPSDDGAAHLGVRASGPRSGSSVLMQGTSMAAANATRHLVDAILAGETVKGNKAEFPIFETGDQKQTSWPDLQVYNTLKFGAGRIFPDEEKEVDRLGRKALAL